LQEVKEITIKVYKNSVNLEWTIKWWKKWSSMCSKIS
jgi:hypothetical protein